MVTFDVDENGQAIKITTLPSGVVIRELNRPAPAPKPVPESVTMSKARRALLAFNKLQMVNDTIATMPGEQGDEARIEWEYSSEVFRDRPLVIALASQFGWTENDLDGLFIYADSLP